VARPGFRTDVGEHFAGRVLSIGEALIDEVNPKGEPTVARPGGSPMNVAVGLARLGVTTSLFTALGPDAAGDQIREYLSGSGVSLESRSNTSRRTSRAVATIGTDGAATYDFDIEWRPKKPDVRGFDLVHTGSIAAAREPGASVVERALAQAEGLVSFDPNVRPALMPPRAEARRRAERFIALSDVVKASDEDVAWLYGKVPLDVILMEWKSAGVRLGCITRGKQGAVALSPAGFIEVPAPSTVVADTVGAGDSFMAGLLAHLLWHGFDNVASSLAFAAGCAAVTVSRVGADPPFNAEVVGAS
jgi:fructokinase